MRQFIIAIAVSCLLALPALADHEVDHRYNLRGYVLDASEKAIANLDVRVSDENGPLKAGKTDSNGYYSLHLHLHDADNRRKLTLRAGNNQAEIRVKIDTSDATTIRVHDANFVGGKLVEGELSRFRISPWVYPVAGLAIFIGLLVMLEKRRKKKLRLKQSGGQPKQPQDSRKAKKARRKKH